MEICSLKFQDPFYSFFSFCGKLFKIPKILHIISPLKHIVHDWRIQVILRFINLNHEGLYVSMVITSNIIVLQQYIEVTCVVI